jgi:hypothetical protein
MTLTPLNPRHRTAIHEAGHSVAAIVAGLQVSYCTIEAKGSTSGRTRLTTKRDECSVVQVGLFVAGGPAAESRLAGARVPARAGDLDSLFDACGEDPNLLAVRFDSYEALAAATVEQHWTWIERVAGALLKRTSLTGDDVRWLKP